MKVPLAGGSATTLALGCPYDIVVDAASVYWTDSNNNAVMSVPLDGGVATTLASGQTRPSTLRSTRPVSTGQTSGTAP